MENILALPVMFILILALGKLVSLADKKRMTR